MSIIPNDGELYPTNGAASNFSDDSSDNSNIQNTSDSSILHQLQTAKQIH